jgi:predicted transcriptional regulator YdeE
MKPRMEKRDVFRVIGVEDEAAKINGEDPGFGQLWMERYMPQSKEIEPYSTDGAAYGVFFNTKGTDLTGGRYVAGAAVRADAPVPKGWVMREIPAAEYAVFDTTLRDIGETSDEALESWLPNSGFEQDTAKARFDYHPPGTSAQESPVSVWIPVKRRT